MRRAAAPILRQLASHNQAVACDLRLPVSARNCRLFSSGAPAPARGRKHAWQSWLQLAVAGALTSWLGVKLLNPPEEAEASCPLCTIALEGLPEYTREEVARHSSREGGGRVWVTYKDGVYDVTPFLDYHPGGGGRILQAAGGAIDPFWAEYPRHNAPHVRQILAGYRVGRLKREATGAAGASTGPTLPRHLVGVTAGTYCLRVEGLGKAEVTLEALRNKFAKHTVAGSVKCSSGSTSARSSPGTLAAGKGGEGAQASSDTAQVWGGVLLRDVLQAAGVRSGDPGATHVQVMVQFESLDGKPIPPLDLSQAMREERGALLAYELNGQPLSPAQGFPLRVVVPGVGGRQNVKWLSKITVGGQELAEPGTGQQAPAVCACKTGM